MRALVPVALALAAASTGCGTEAARTVTAPQARELASGGAGARAAAAPRCERGAVRRLGSPRIAYVGYAPAGAVAYRAPGGATVARFERLNANGYGMFFGVLGERLGPRCAAAWYRVQLPIRPNGATGWIRASALRVEQVRARIEIDLSKRLLTAFRGGRRVLEGTVAVGSPATPTPVGRYYVNQRLVPEDRGGPFGPGAIGISAFSPVLTGWAQGGPVAIHGTNEPWSIGHAVSNGCVRLPNPTLSRLFRLAAAGTPVIIHP